MSTKDGGPAFPAPRMEWEEGGYGQASRWVPKYGELEGMTLRDYFAAKVLQGIWSSPEILKVMRVADDGKDADHIAAVAYEQADAMLKAREA